MKRYPKYLCPVWGKMFFQGKKFDLSMGADVADFIASTVEDGAVDDAVKFINSMPGVLNGHLLCKALKTAQLKEELEPGFLRGFLRKARGIK